MKAPSNLPLMITRSLFTVQPPVHRHLKDWARSARAIPDPELRRQALLSIDTKAFHCEGGAILALLGGVRYDEAICFIVAYQTISDYLDNLCDRSTSLDPEDFAALHEAMHDALEPNAPLREYYRFHQEKDDGGYLAGLVRTCQGILSRIPTYEHLAPYTRELAKYYCELQVHKHVRKEERIIRLQEWFKEHRANLPVMSWYEFAACTGSTLGIFCLVSKALGENLTPGLAEKMRDAYFPWVQGLHILLDYLIDQEEDRLGGDLNFCSFYPNEGEMTTRLIHFYRQASSSVSTLPDARFHRFINIGLLSTYLADRKVAKQKQIHRLARRMLFEGGWEGIFLYLHCFIYRRIKFGFTEA